MSQLRKTQATKAAAASPMAVDPAVILTPVQLAERLQVTPGWIRQKCRSRCENPLPHYRLGRYVRFDWAAVSVWLQRTAA